MSAESRAHPRYAIELECELELAPDGRKLRGRTHDISRGGFSLFIPTGATVEGGTVCGIRLALVFSETEFSEQLSLRGTVMWCTPLNLGAQLGVRLDGLDAQSRGFLDLFVKFLEDGPEDGPEEPTPPSTDDV